MAITVDNTNFNRDATNGLTSKTINFTCTGTNLALVVAVAGFCDTTTDQISGITYNGVSMTRKLAFTPGSEQCYIYALINPASGAHDVVMTFSPSWQYQLQWGIASFTGVNAIGSATGGRQASGVSSPWSDSISMTAGSTAVDALFAGYRSGGWTLGGSQVRLGTQVDDGTADSLMMSTLVDATAMSWSWGEADNQRASHVIMELQPSTGAAPNTPNIGETTITVAEGIIPNLINMPRGFN